MKRLSILLLLAVPGFAHRLDEYLQATLLSVSSNRVQGTMRLIPGVAVASVVLTSVDRNGDGVLSVLEQRDYAQRVLDDVTLSMEGEPLKPKLGSVSFPQTGEMKEGLGEIQIEFSADIPAAGGNRRIVFENHHQSRISAYLVNCLVPRQKDIRITGQERNYNQSFYQLDYAQAGFAGLPGMFRLGMRHIAKGTDHLLFLLTLLLPAPLLVVGARWAGFGGTRHSVMRILKVVTAFTIGHSITLALAAAGVVRVPSRPIEVLIAVSILVSAIHALRPLFAGREAVIAAFFGLIHGLAFAATLGDLGLGFWQRVGSIGAFNLGIEVMQLMVIGATMPSLVLLSRTGAYSALRMGGALFAGVASAGWTVERLFSLHSFVDALVDQVAQRGLWFAGILFVVSLSCWIASRKALVSPEFSQVLRSGG